MKNVPLLPAEILLPKADLEKWAVIACDQFTSDRDYWNQVESIVGDAPSALRLTLPEIYLTEKDVAYRIEKVSASTKEALEKGIFKKYPSSYFYIERTQPDGRVRPGLVGMVDLEAYDYRRDAVSLVRATEQTVVDRLPPRVAIRRRAYVELPHVMLLADDPEKKMIEPLAGKKDSFEKVYDFDLMLGGGHIVGYRVDDETAEELMALQEKMLAEKPLLFAVGDGNHSLATAKECYRLVKEKIGEEAAKKHPARYALTEVINLHDPALDFEPIYRVMFDVNAADLIADLKNAFEDKTNNDSFTCVTNRGREKIGITLEPGELIVGKLQNFLDEWMKSHPTARIDYIHEEAHTVSLAQKENAVGFLYRGIGKEDLFPAVVASGSLPRKTFSMGVSRDKRYYLEAREITDGKLIEN